MYALTQFLKDPQLSWDVPFHAIISKPEEFCISTKSNVTAKREWRQKDSKSHFKNVDCPR